MSRDDRLHALDAVRGFALILGILFHGTAGYVEGFPEILWPMREPSSTTLGLVFFVSHMFRMSLFFLIAGFFGRMLIERRGMAGFVRDRARRILLPLVAGLPIVLILFSVLGGLGFLLSGMSLRNPLPWHWTIKYPLQITATLMVLFVSYRYLVRSTFIGATLNGRRYARSLPAGAPQPTEVT